MVIRTIAALAAVLALSAICRADPPPPDFSRPALQRVFSAHVIELGDKPKPRVQFRFGAIEFRALGMDWRVLYLPLAMPLSGTRPTTSSQPPDPFALTGLGLTGQALGDPQLSRRDQRELKAELKRIRRLDRRSRLVPSP